MVLCLAGLVLAAPAWGAPTPGLVAAYAFDEGSGVSAVDASGNGRTGSVAGATWSTGRYGGALSFDGTNDYVSLPGLGTFYNAAFTLEAWVQKATVKNDVGIVGTWAGNGPMLWIDHLATRYQLTLGGSLSSYLDSGVNPLTGQWQHLAASFDGTTARFYINGVEVASRAVSGAVGTSNTWRIGAYGTVPGGFFDGLIDEIRVYDRALSTTEVQADMSQPLGITDPGAPTTPGNLAVTGSTGTSISLGWTASTDDTGVSGYHVFADGAAAGTTSATSFTVTGLTCSTGHLLEVEAFDAAGNTSPRASVSGSTTSCGTPSGLVAAYAFEEGSGTAANDASGNGKNGTISGASWATGRNGTGLSFDGTDDHVALGSLGTFYNTAFTLEAWVQKTTAKKDVGIVGSWTGSGPMLWVDHLAGHHYTTLGGSLSSYLDSGQSPDVGQWQHLAATFDGTTAHYYVNGVSVASRVVIGSVGTSDTWRIGAYGASPGGFLDGVVDDVRVYSRALSAGEIQFDRDHGVTPPSDPIDSTPPSQPGTLTATGSHGQVALNSSAATDNVAVTKYNLHRSTTSGFTPSAGNRIAQPTGLSYTDLSLAGGTYYYKVTAQDGAGNVGP
ncbi:MAG TPA: LamG-like jellyroll fold domain-containing protein, partial [Desertimonas sp.]|nr:LamG-like jellyroll fold domain-containing protein [Desertimonas sp.]